jgi:hypothetical protein
VTSTAGEGLTAAVADAETVLLVVFDGVVRAVGEGDAGLLLPQAHTVSTGTTSMEAGAQRTGHSMHGCRIPKADADMQQGGADSAPPCGRSVFDER